MARKKAADDNSWEAFGTAPPLGLEGAGAHPGPSSGVRRQVVRPAAATELMQALELRLQRGPQRVQSSLQDQDTVGIGLGSLLEASGMLDSDEESSDDAVLEG